LKSCILPELAEDGERFILIDGGVYNFETAELRVLVSD